MLRCFVEHAVSELDMSLVTPALGGPSPPLESCQVRIALGELRLMRNLVDKGEVLVPYIPTKQVLLLFPCSIEAMGRASLAPEAENKMNHFLSYLHRASGDLPFSVGVSVLCKLSGSAALVIECATIDDALTILDVCGDVRGQDQDMRMSSQYVQSFACQYLPSPEVATEEQRRALLRDLYYVPACTLCAERLDPTLSGKVGAQRTPVCGCFGAGNGRSAPQPQQRGCTCLQTSGCYICEQLLAAQLATGSNGSSSGGPQPQQHLTRCQDCRQSGDPWICVICGYVGCSRYQAMHAKDHFVRTCHFFSINLLTQQIWDYESDAFVHHTMFLLDADSGKTTRLQYPGKEDADAGTLLGRERGGSTGHGDDGEDGDEDDAFPASAHKHSDPWAEKKFVSSKYDAKLSTANTQYATVLKNELDAMRAVYVEEAWLAAKEADRATELTRDEVGRMLEKRDIVLPVAAGAHSHSDDDNDSDGGPNDTHEAIADTIRSTAAEQAFYEVFFAALNPPASAHANAQQECQSVEYGNGHLRAEMTMREDEGASLEATAATLMEDLRTAMRQNITATLEVTCAIEELETTLREIDMNVTMQRRIAARMGDGDSAAHVVVMGGGTEESGGKKSDGRSAGKGKGKGANK